MSESDQRLYRAMQKEIAESDNPRARYQAQLDCMWWEKRAIAEEEARLRRELNPILKIWD